MPMSRITLTAPAHVVKLAGIQARKEKTSISAMFASFILAKSRESPTNEDMHKPGPLTRQISGIISLPDDFDEKAFMAQEIEKRHGGRK
jgi:hypothetical protein